MKSTFDYKYEKTGLAQLVINDLGNCSIEADKVIRAGTPNEEIISYFLIVRTLEGKMSVFEYGPTIIKKDWTDGLSYDNCYCSYYEVDYSDYKLQKIIDKFLNDPKRGITVAKTVKASDALNSCVSIVDYMRMITQDVPESEDVIGNATMEDEED